MKLIPFIPDPRTAKEHGGASPRFSRAFSLLEMLVASAILVIMMLGLLGMFYQTDRALRLTFQQRDILDAGRTAMEVMVRDLSMATAADFTQATNLLVFANYPGLIQGLNDASLTEERTNTLQSFCFLTRENDFWNGIRYDFDFDLKNNNSANNTIVGTLYRRQITDWATNVTLVSSNIVTVDLASVQVPSDFDFGRVAEGVVHHTVRCFNANGYLITDLNDPDPFSEPQIAFPFENVYGYVFTGTNMPAYIDVEFGILEPKVFRIASGMSPTAAAAYLRDKAGAVQLFRERIPLRYTPPIPSTVTTF